MDDKNLFIRRMNDLADQADRIGYVVFSDFLDGSQRAQLMHSDIIRRVHIAWIGGYEEAERAVAAFYPSFIETGDWESPVRVLRISLKGAKFVRRELTHRDYLGSLMGLGIKREKLGDILVDDNGAYVICLEGIAGYISDNLISVGSADVNCGDASEQDLQNVNSDGKELVITVSSLRLDGLIGRGFNLSRKDAAAAITTGHVSVNWLEEKRIDRSLNPQDVISVRGFGRIRILEILGVSRSGRQQVRIERFG